MTVEHDCYWLRHLPEHHEDETGQHQGGVRGGNEGDVLLSFTISLLTGIVCERAGERERE